VRGRRACRGRADQQEGEGRGRDAGEAEQQYRGDGFRDAVRREKDEEARDDGHDARACGPAGVRLGRDARRLLREERDDAELR